ncbi:MAG TPA: ketol-acid reductoisomerase [Dongiaceae bacterium]|nr:ketol-acid reductoisomerase [Dongiaceae bacterium]
MSTGAAPSPPPSRLADRVVAILGFGNQGEAQALNLRDSGVRVIVGARAGGAGERRAREHGFETHPLAEAARYAAIAAVMLPDDVTPVLWPTLRPALEPDTALVFAHGYVPTYGGLEMPSRSDVVLVSPTGPGRVLREVFVRGDGLPAYLAVHRDVSGGAWALAEAYAEALGCARARLLRTNVRHETEVDLFGEQAVLCGGMNALVIAAFETLTAAGYAPELAYLEVVHQLKYLADLVHERGIAGMREGISSTALYGDLTRGPRVIDGHVRAALAGILAEIRSGEFAAEFARWVATGRPRVPAATPDGLEALERARRSALGRSPKERA